MHKQKRKNSDIRPVEPFQWGTWFGYLFIALTWPFKAGWQALTWLVQHGWTAFTWLVRNSWTALTWTVQSSWQALTWTVSGIWALLRYVLVGHVPEFETAQEEFAFWRIKRKYRRRRLLMVHAVAFAVGLIGNVAVWLNISQVYARNGLDMPGIITQQHLLFALGWLMLLGLHAAWVRMGNAEDDDLQQTLETSRQKAKRRVYEETYHVPERLVDAADRDDIYEDEERIWQEHYNRS